MRSLWLEQQILTYRKEVPSPLPEEGQALIRILLSGICSTDLELVRGYYPFSGIPGHEFVGEVVSSPGDPTWVGKRVVGEISIACGNCNMCVSGFKRHCENRKTLGIYDWNGAFADYLVLPLTNLHEVPPQVTNEMAVFTEPLAAAHEILEQTTINHIDRVLIIGAGRLGLLTAMVIQQTGCELVVVTRHQKQNTILEKCNIQTISEKNIGSKKYDIVIEATGSVDGFAQACKSIRPRGRIILKSTYKENSEVNFSRIVVDEVTLIGSRCGSFEPALRLLAEEKIDPLPLIETIVSLEQGVSAFIHAAEPGILKILIKPV